MKDLMKISSSDAAFDIWALFKLSPSFRYECSEGLCSLELDSFFNWPLKTKERSSLCSQLSQRWGVFEFRVYNDLDSNCFNARACTNSSAGFSWKCSRGLIQILLKWKTLADLSGLWIRSMEKCFYEKNAFTVALIQQGIWACTQSFCMCMVLLAHTWLLLSKVCTAPWMAIKNLHCVQLGLRFFSLVGARVKRFSPQALQSFGNLLSVREINAKSCIPGLRLSWLLLQKPSWRG